MTQLTVEGYYNLAKELVKLEKEEQQIKNRIKEIVVILDESKIV